MMTRVARLRRLQKLSIAGERSSMLGYGDVVRDAPLMGDAGLERLRGLTRLKMLRLAATRVTADGLKAFHAARPDVAIVADHGPMGNPIYYPPAPATAPGLR
jgi:hypothetical protein